MASAGKRCASAAGAVQQLTDPRRVRALRGGKAGGPGKRARVDADVGADGGQKAGGPVVYWCDRDKRVKDNWSLLYASEMSRSMGVGLAVVVSLAEDFWEMGARHSKFALEGLREMERRLSERDIPFFLLQGEPQEVVPKLLDECGAGLLVCDFSPLRTVRARLDGVMAATPGSLRVHQVDSHNVVPLWVASDKQEYAARTIRPKINRVLHEWLVDYPALPSPAFGAAWDKPIPCSVDWEVHIKHACSAGDGASVHPLEWCHGGESAGKEALKDFLSEKRLSTYDTSRNDPTKPSAVSNLSPWINFGFLSAQRAAYAAKRLRAAAPKYAKSIDGFTEELVIRRELSDNFCYHNEHYDAVAGASQWAQDSLRLHAADKREHLYTESQFERAATHDDLWNAAQLELVYHGKMHGFMRMYWCVAPLPL